MVLASVCTIICGKSARLKVLVVGLVDRPVKVAVNAVTSDERTGPALLGPIAVIALSFTVKDAVPEDEGDVPFKKVNVLLKLAAWAD